jgi:hypothetical protein
MLVPKGLIPSVTIPDLSWPALAGQSRPQNDEAANADDAGLSPEFRIILNGNARKYGKGVRPASPVLNLISIAAYSPQLI